MNGAGMSRESHRRTAAETVTIAASHAPSGTRAARARSPSGTEVDLGEPTCDLRRLGRPRPDAHRGGRLADVAEHLVRDVPSADDTFEGSDVQLGDPLEVVLSSCQGVRSLAHRPPGVRTLREQTK